MSKTKLSDYIVEFFEKKGFKTVFLISGGGCIHLIDSVGKSKKLRYICNHHEQACAIAAEAYARVTGKPGLCIVTTGPGGTNTITGVLGAWLDSVPMIVISGQVKRETMGAGRGLRHLGDQEINIIDIVRPITKYAVVVMEPLDIDYHLEKALFLAASERPGPVWLDIPLDVQGAFINKNELKKFVNKKSIGFNNDELKKDVKLVLNKIVEAGKPVLLVGNGVRLGQAVDDLQKLISLLKIPTLTGFAGFDIVSSENPYFAGRPGTIGQRSANFTLQNSDLLLIIGSRLNIRMVGYNYQTVARGAYKIMVDIDKQEMNKKTIKIDLKLNYDAKEFIQEMIKQLRELHLQTKKVAWLQTVNKWKQQYPSVPKEYWNDTKYVNPYCFIETLSKFIKSDDILALSDATASICTYQALKFPYGTRVLTNSGCAPMGYGLPAAIGACFANDKKNTICIEGDGSIQLNIQELQTLVHHVLPIKIFLYNNRGYVSIRLTQKNLFKGHYVASSSESGVSYPNMIKIAKAYGIHTEKISNNNQIARKIKKVLSYKGPVLCEINVSPNQEFLPKAASRRLPDGSFVSRPLEDMYPFLSKEELKKNMFIPLIDDL